MRFTESGHMARYAYPSIGNRKIAKRATTITLMVIGAVTTMLLIAGGGHTSPLGHKVSMGTNKAAGLSYDTGSAEQSMPPGYEQAIAINTILSEMSRTRAQLVPALDIVRSCEQPEIGTATLNMITKARRAQLDAVRALQVDAIKSGSSIQSRLEDAVNASLNADESFLAWARGRTADNCSIDRSGDSDYQKGLSFSEGASAAKQSFLDLWNPVAREYDLPERTGDGI